MEQESGGVQGAAADAVKKKASSVYYATRAKLVAARHGNPARNMHVIAVMGASGKTTTACYIAELLKEAGKSVGLLTNRGVEIKGEYSEKLYHRDVTTLQTVLKSAKQKQVDFLVIEVSKYMVDRHIIDGVDLDTVVVTNCFDSVETAVRTVLAQSVDFIVLPHDNTTLLHDMSIPQHKVISFGDSPDADSTIEKVVLYRKGTEVKLVIDNQTTIDVATYLVGRSNSYNVAAAVATAYVLGVDLDIVPDGIARLNSVTSNYEYISTNQPYDIVVDGASNENSVTSVVASARELAKRRLIVVVVSDGLSVDTLQTVVKSSDRCIVIDTTEQTTLPGVESVPTAKDAATKAFRGAKIGDTVLLVGKMFSVRQESGETLADLLVRHMEAE